MAGDVLKVVGTVCTVVSMAANFAGKIIKDKQQNDFITIKIQEAVEKALENK